MNEQPVTATLVADESRIEVLPKHFGGLMLLVENAIYDSLWMLSREYRGGYWRFYELSNGGFYMAPDVEPLRVWVGGNGFDDRLSADAAGIISCLFAYSHVSIARNAERIADHYHWLREFANTHPEATKIGRAID